MRSLVVEGDEYESIYQLHLGEKELEAIITCYVSLHRTKFELAKAASFVICRSRGESFVWVQAPGTHLEFPSIEAAPCSASKVGENPGRGLEPRLARHSRTFLTRQLQLKQKE